MESDSTPSTERAMPAPVLICTVGLPRSGKSTWAKGTGHPVVCPDAIRLAVHGQRFRPQAEPFIWATAKLMVRALFLAGHPVVVLDATNVTMKRRKEWRDADWVTEFKVFATTYEECVARLAASNEPAYIEEMTPILARMRQDFETLAPWEAESDAE